VKDEVGAHLDAIAAEPLLTAAEEVQLARRIEAGLYAQTLLDRGLPPELMDGAGPLASVEICRGRCAMPSNAISTLAATICCAASVAAVDQS